MLPHLDIGWFEIVGYPYLLIRLQRQFILRPKRTKHSVELTVLQEAPVPRSGFVQSRLWVHDLVAETGGGWRCSIWHCEGARPAEPRTQRRQTGCPDICTANRK